MFLVTQVTSQVEVFKKHLEKFAAEHKNDIKSKPEFRAQFQQMCARIGVDPLACEYAILMYWVILACSL